MSYWIHFPLLSLAAWRENAARGPGPEKTQKPKNNKRVLFNFFKPRLPIKAEQTYPATSKPLLSGEFHKKKKKDIAFKRVGGAGGMEEGYRPNENFTLTEIIKGPPPKRQHFASLIGVFSLGHIRSMQIPI